MSAGSTRDRITCPHCQGSLKAPPLPAGSLCTCPKCGQSFPVGQPAGSAAAPPAAPPARAAARPATPARPAASPPPSVKPPANRPPVEAPVRAELADEPVLMKPVRPVAMTSAVKMPPAQVADRGRPATDLQQEQRLHDLLAVPGKGAVASSAQAPPHQATVLTEPAHQQAAPSAVTSRPAPRPVDPEIPVVCKLCGTRMYAQLNQVGGKIRCPDCHTENPVLAPQAPAAVAPARRPVQDGEDIGLSDPGVRPGYRPLVEPRGEYEAIKYLDPTAPPRRPGEHPRPRPVSTEMTMTLSQAAIDENEGEEVVISAPVDRIETKEVVKLPEPDDPDDDNQYRGRFRDEEWGFIGDPRQKDAWKKSPFFLGIVSFPFYPQTAMRFVVYSVFLSIDLAMYLVAIAASSGETPMLFAAIGLTISSSVLSVFILGGSLPCLVAVAQDTANGADAVESWPDWNIAEWLFTALMIPAAAFLAALPGSIVSSGLFSMGTHGILMAPFPILVSELMFFPIVFGSMLAEGSFMPVSGTILGSLQRRAEGWLLFYMASVLLGIPLAASMALFELGVQAGTIFVAPFAAVLWVLSITLYFRLLGRLLWYVQNYKRERDRPE